jgi:hypothetical protein
MYVCVCVCACVCVCVCVRMCALKVWVAILRSYIATCPTKLREFFPPSTLLGRSLTHFRIFT